MMKKMGYVIWVAGLLLMICSSITILINLNHLVYSAVGLIVFLVGIWIEVVGRELIKRVSGSYPYYWGIEL